MFGSTVLDTAIGLVFVYLMVSLACTSLKEAIEIWWKQRANYLQEGVARLMGGDATWLGNLYNEPLIRSLCRGDDRKQWPAYIPSGLFAQALVALVRESGRRAPAPAGEPPAGGTTLPPTPAQEFLALVGTIQNEAVKRSLLAAVRHTSQTMDQVHADIEEWFNGAMDRVSGWYKQWSQRVILVVGGLVVLILNVDTLAIGRVLWSDQRVREVVVANAKDALEKDALAKAALAKGAPPPAGAAPAPAGQGAAPDDVLKDVKKARAELSKLGLPVGWDGNDPMSVPSDVGGWVFKFLGLLMTILAVSLGAPFWFDVLNRIMIVRSTVKPREKSPDEPPLDGPPPAPRSIPGRT